MKRSVFEYGRNVRFVMIRRLTRMLLFTPFILKVVFTKGWPPRCFCALIYATWRGGQEYIYHRPGCQFFIY